MRIITLIKMVGNVSQSCGNIPCQLGDLDFNSSGSVQQVIVLAGFGNGSGNNKDFRKLQ